MANQPTRQIFFHISTGGQVLFYLLAAVATGLCFYGFYRKTATWRQGRPVPAVHDWPARIKTLFDQILAHRRVRRRNYAGKMHLLIFFGFAALFTGTCIVGIEHYGALLFGNHWLYRGGFYLLCKLTLDLFGLGLLAGTLMALVRRYSGRPPSLGHEAKDGAFLALLLATTLTGFLLEGAGLAADPHRAPWAAWSPVGRLFSMPLQGISVSGYAVVWWIHMPLVFGVIAALPYGRWLHLFVIPASIALQPDRPMGALEPIKIEEVEETGRIGLGTVADMDRWQLLSLDGCMECGRCTDACPAHAVGKELNPKQIVLDLRALASSGSGDRNTDVISDESLWACTNCHACVRECPALIRHVDIIDGIRRFRVAEGRLSGTAAVTLRQLNSRENPWGLPKAQRLDWAKGLDVPIASDNDGREVLLWVGCAGAFEPRAQKTTRAIVELLEQAGVKFAVLGPRERCTGDPARRIGDEFLFQQLAQANVETLDSVGARRIVTQCPHCFHTLKNEYPQFGGQYETVHHTQLLADLIGAGRLNIPADYAESITYHDPCFLARVNGETGAPRLALAAAAAIPLTEPFRRESKTFCCGAGGGRMWMEEPPAQRPGLNRAQELIATGARTVAVGCPFCRVMVGDSVAQAGGDQAPAVMDVAEILLAATKARSVPPEQSAPTAEARPESSI